MTFFKYFSELCPFETVTCNDIQMPTCSVTTYILLYFECSLFLLLKFDLVLYAADKHGL